MSAMPIEWHEECLANQIAYETKVYAEYVAAYRRWQKTVDEIARYRAQIERAKRLGKTRFDAERFRDTE